jgi:hypothetical protein
LNTIVELLNQDAAADERRHSENLNALTTLSKLTGQLNAAGFVLRRSAVYLRLQPLRSNTIEGKRHVNTVPVKLLRAQNDERKKHIAANFAYTTVAHCKEIVSILGPKVCNFISCDDKAHVPLGLAAASKQSPLMMHVEYKVKLPDHDFVVASKHKLVPSVYAHAL